MERKFDVRNGEPHNQNISDVNENRHSEECLNCELDEESSIVNGEVQLESDRNISNEQVSIWMITALKLKMDHQQD